MELPKNEGGTFELTPAGTVIGRCYRFLDLGSHEQTFQGESKGMKRLVMISFELPTELMQEGEYAGKPFTISKRYTWSTHEKANMRKDLESWRGAKFNDNDFGPGGFDVRNLLGVAATLNIVHSERNDKTYANISSIGRAMKGIDIPAAINKPVYFSLEPSRFDGNVFDGLSDKLKDFIRETPEYRSLMNGGKSNGNGYAKARGYDQSPLDQKNEPAGQRDFAPIDDRDLDDEIPF